MINRHAIGQEIILSQPFSVSQYQNAAAAGSGSYDNRLQANYRNPIVGGEIGLFQTKTIAFDTRIIKDREESKNYFGYGFQLVNDRIMNGVMQNNYFTLNLAYHIFLDQYLNSQIAAGIGTTYAQSSLDNSKLRFGDQYDYRDLLSYSSIDYIKPYASNFSFNAAVMYTNHNARRFIQTAVMAYKYDKPNVTFSPFNKASDFSYRAFANCDFALNETDDGDEGNSILFNFNYLNTASKNNFTIGSLVGLKIKKDYENLYKMYFGCSYKLNESYIPTMAFLLDKNTFGLSYDVYTNNITAANIKLSAYELTYSRKLGYSKMKYADNKPGRMKTLFD